MKAASARKIQETKKQFLKEAVHITAPVSKRGILDRLFTLAFGGFVYPQIWEDPEVDLKALNIVPDKSRILTISSGGCNIMNYLTQSPAAIHAVDLNPAHVALTRLKIAAAQHLPDYESFFTFFGCADNPVNVDNYNRYIAPHLDAATRGYWEKREWPSGQRRISYFRRNLYSFGLLGRFIGAVHFLAKLYGQDPQDILNALNMADQRAIFERTLGPIFDKAPVRFLCNMPVSLYGLGIPPAQFAALQEASHGDMAGLLKERLERLACAYPIEDNYFAWQAFGRGYDRVHRRAVPRYLQEDHYAFLKDNTHRVAVYHATLNQFLETQGADSLDCYVFLDAQDWMNAQQLTALWDQVSRTAAPKARVIFRTAGEHSPLPKALTPDMLGHWDYDEAACKALGQQDRSSIYGGFHLYTLK